MLKRIKDSRIYLDVKELKALSNQLNYHKRRIQIILFLDIILLSFASLTLEKWQSSELEVNPSSILFAAIIAVSILGVIYVYLFSKISVKALTAFDKMSDEIDWKKENRKKFIHRRPIELKEISRELINATDLPFTTGKSGELSYILFFTLIVIVTIIIRLI